jgi:hypothetical protein
MRIEKKTEETPAVRIAPTLKKIVTKMQPMRTGFALIALALAAGAADDYAKNGSNAAMGILRTISAFFVPRDPVVLWGSVWIFAVITRNIYAQYLSSTFIWFDTPLAGFASSLAPYCADAQMISAFYSTIFSHFLVYGPFPPHPITILVCSFGALVSMMSMLDSGSCSFLGMSAAIGIGSALGYLRILFYADVISPPPPTEP